MPPLLTRKEEAQALRLARSQPESAEEFNALLARLRSRVVEAVLADDRIRGRLAAVRHRVVAVDYREDKPEATEEPVRLAEVAMYDYDRDVLVFTVADLRRGELVDLYDVKVPLHPSPTRNSARRASCCRTCRSSAGHCGARTQPSWRSPRRATPSPHGPNASAIAAAPCTSPRLGARCSPRRSI